jgi:tetratricopeptide (TPR) repeat protein
VLGLRELRERMARPLPLLTGGRSDAPPRHRTLRACIAASVDALDPDDRKFLASLAVFHGGFTLDAVSAVTDLPADRTLDTVDGLVGRSLVERRTSPGGGRRFDLLQTIREYLAEEANPDLLDQARRSHADFYYGQFGPVLDASSSVHTSAEWTALLPDCPNIRAAIRWARDVGDAERFADLVNAAGGMWERLGPREELEDWLSHCIADPRTRPGRVIDALVRRVAIAYHIGDLRRAEEDLGRARLRAEAADELRQAWVLVYEPWLLLLAGDLDGAAKCADRVRHAVANAGDPVELRVYHLLLVASVADQATASAAREELLQLAVDHDLYPLTGTALNICCELDLEQGNYDRVLVMTDLGLRITREAKDTYRYGWLISQRGLARMETGDLDGAVNDLRASLELAQGDSLAKGLEDIMRLAVWCVRSGRHETGAVLLGMRDAAVPLISSADSVLVKRSRERDLAELPALLGAGYDAALGRGRALVAASPDGVLAAALRVLDEAGTRQPVG